MRFKILLLIMLALFGCHSNDQPGEMYRGGMMYYYAFFYRPEQMRKEQCSQPNAIGFSYIDYDGRQYYCLNNKVSQGLIYDANTNVAITADTLSAGQSLLCKCPGSTGGQWQRGKIVEENPAPGVSISFILTTTSSNVPIKYPTNYNQQDNLYCISQCSVTDFSTLKYQFLKIR